MKLLELREKLISALPDFIVETELEDRVILIFTPDRKRGVKLLANSGMLRNEFFSDIVEIIIKDVFSNAEGG